MNRPDNLIDYIDQFKVVHGNGIWNIPQSKLDYIPTVDKNLRIVTATSYPGTNPFNNRLVSHPDKINFSLITLPEFNCFLDKVRVVLETARNSEEKYIMWVDYSDTAIVNDIENIEEILDFYQCKILFNAEDGYHMPGHPCIDQSYRDEYLQETGVNYYSTYFPIGDLNKEELRKKTNLPFDRSLNAGVFVGEKNFLIECLEYAHSLMTDDFRKGFPYGDKDDQLVWRYIQNKKPGIEVDYLNKFLIWTHGQKFHYPVDSWEHYDYFNRNIKQ